MKVPIYINQKQYSVTTNCHAALLRLRDIAKEDDDNNRNSDKAVGKGKNGDKQGPLAVRPTYLWIDAICINQNDAVEKSAQVRFMCQIYRLAEEVIVWLGSSVRDEKRVDEYDETLAFSLIEDLVDDPDMYDDFEAFIEVAQRRDNAKRSWEALTQIFNHPWFTRVWAHQEIVVASKATVLGQYGYIPWDSVEAAAAMIQKHSPNCEGWQSRYIDWGLDKSLWQQIRDCGYRHAWGRCHTKAFFDMDSGFLKGMTLLDLMPTISTYSCTDPRDFVFSVTGLFEAERQQSIVPDYSEPIPEVYTSLAWWAIQEYQNLEILALAELNNYKANISPRLPSWVRYWRCNCEQYRLPYPLYHATLVSKPMTTLTNLSTLEVQGIKVDTVFEILPPDDTETTYHWGYSGEPLSLWRQHFTEYPTGCDPVHAWIRTITADVDNDGSRLTPSQLHRFNSKIRAFSEENSEKDDGVGCLAETIIEFIQAMSCATAYRRFFVSKRGHMGIGPELSRIDDMICVLPGCQVPVLIRKHEGYHVFVGECFVWGLMDGEAMGKERDGYETFRLR